MNMLVRCCIETRKSTLTFSSIDLRSNTPRPGRERKTIDLWIPFDGHPILAHAVLSSACVMV
jgi:hypothetical protein